MNKFDLSPHEAALMRYVDLLCTWNEKINLISRKDADNVVLHHILPAILLASQIKDGAVLNIWDVGTGGGLPGIPLAIMRPKVQVTLIDSTKKKVGAAEAMVCDLGLTNAVGCAERVEVLPAQADVIVGRGVADILKFIDLVGGKFIQRRARILYLSGVMDVPQHYKYFKLNVYHLRQMLLDFQLSACLGKTVDINDTFWDGKVLYDAERL